MPNQDGMGWVYPGVGNNPEAYQRSAKTMHLQSQFIADFYHPNSVKSMERRRRRSRDKLIIKGASTKKPKFCKEFLSKDEININ